VARALMTMRRAPDKVAAFRGLFDMDQR